ncbi:hypothetical protein M9H77_02561 [Catharanthus roseus]|uniref:Uncharacterized protein n=1 Tax=Catharanthus roseus TaxID=4058 RepID=A0ACC0C8Q9_CATRO|nr:hypothetical protein M9H77_02561 [Catharanthus roseus]
MVTWERIGILAPNLHPGLKFGGNQVNGRVSGLHCTWLVPRTRASSDDVDGGAKYLEGVAQSVFTWTSHHVLRWDGRLVESQEGLETEVGPRTDLISSERSGAQQATEVLGQEFFWIKSPQKGICLCFIFLDSNRL